MANWDARLTRPGSLDEAAAAAWFDRIATRLLRGTHLLVAGTPHRLTEVEFYYFSESHPDPFTHRDPLQRARGRWYFHRTGGTYKGGSFKGIDLTFGDGEAYGGVLIRGLERPDGTLVDGPSLCVDHLLAACGVASVAALDAYDVDPKPPMLGRMHGTWHARWVAGT